MTTKAVEPRMRAAAGRKSFGTLWLDALFYLKKRKKKNQKEITARKTDFDIGNCGAAGTCTDCLKFQNR
jgi:hypothetical protein